MKKTVQKGDRFEVIENINTKGMSHWFKPFTGDFSCMIPKGAILIADDNQLEGAEGFYLVPEDYKKMEERLVPKEIRSQEKYASYSFVFMNTDINKILNPI